MHAPPNPLVIVDHIGIAVRSLERAIDDWGRLFGYRQVTEIVVNTRQKVRVVFLRKDASIDIKLIEPTDETSPIYGFTARGGGLHHLCFRCDDVDAELARLNALGARTLRPPEPGEAFCDESIAFAYVLSGLNVELIATDKRARLLEQVDE